MTDDPTPQDPKPDDLPEEIVRQLLHALERKHHIDLSPIIDLSERPTLGEVIDAIFAVRRSEQSAFGERARKAHAITGDHLLDWLFGSIPDGTDQEVAGELDSDAVLYAISELTCLPHVVQVWYGIATATVRGLPVHELKEANLVHIWLQDLCSKLYMRGYARGRRAQQEIDLLNRTVGGIR